MVTVVYVCVYAYVGVLRCGWKSSLLFFWIFLLLVRWLRDLLFFYVLRSFSKVVIIVWHLFFLFLYYGWWWKREIVYKRKNKIRRKYIVPNASISFFFFLHEGAVLVLSIPFLRVNNIDIFLPLPKLSPFIICYLYM